MSRRESLFTTFHLFTFFIVVITVHNCNSEDSKSKVAPIDKPESTELSTAAKIDSIDFDASIPGEWYGQSVDFMYQESKGHRPGPSLTKDKQQFPLFFYHSDPNVFFKYASIANHTSIIDVRKLDIYKDMKGFTEYYETIRNKDFYELQEMQSEILEHILKAKTAYDKEEDKYRKTLFTILKKARIRESDYDFDNEVQRRIFLNPPDPCGDSRTLKHSLATFENAPTSSLVQVPLSLKDAKEFYDGRKGRVGDRISTVILKYWVSASTMLHRDAHCLYSDLSIKRVELSFPDSSYATILEYSTTHPDDYSSLMRGSRKVPLSDEFNSGHRVILFTK